MIIKNIDRGEIERLRSLGFKGRFRLRGPRRNRREHQDASPEVATHGTLYTTNSYVKSVKTGRISVVAYDESHSRFSTAVDTLEEAERLLQECEQAPSIVDVRLSNEMAVVRAPAYALTGWAGEKPILQQLDSPDSRPKHLNHTNRRVIA